MPNKYKTHNYKVCHVQAITLILSRLTVLKSIGRAQNSRNALILSDFFLFDEAYKMIDKI